MTRHRVAGAFVWLLGGSAVIAAVLVAVIYVPVIALFGRDDPAQTTAGYLLAIATPMIAVAIVIAAVTAAVHLHGKGRDAAAVALATLLCGIVVFGCVHMLPH